MHHHLSLGFALITAAATIGCSDGIGGKDDVDPDIEIPTLEIPDPGDVPSDVSALMGDADECSDSPFWGEANMATTFFGGEFILGESSFVGAEYWVLYFNPTMTNNGYHDCAVRWEVAGTIDEPVRTGTYSMTLSAQVDLSYINCEPDVSGQPMHVGEESYLVTYDILELDNGTVRIYYTSGTQLGEGKIENGRLIYASKKNCKAF